MQIQTIRDKSILTGLFLSKFDKKALNELGFESFSEAFNVLGYSIGSKPASLKNYRDEFDPCFPNSRQGWHGRSMRDNCKRIYDDFSELPFNEFVDLIKSFVKDFDVLKIDNKYSATVAKRLVTGRAAEEYFRKSYKKEKPFENCNVEDTTQAACGFDFRLSCGKGFFLVEVKGLSTKRGTISLTEKEFKVAKSYGKKFCLFAVLNFSGISYHQIYFDPLKSNLNFKRNERQVVQISYASQL